MIQRIFSLFAVILLAGCVIIDADNASINSVSSADTVRAEAAVRLVLTEQQAAWNRGDIDAFMEGYWKSEDLRFASGGTVTRGWQGTIDRYKRRYQDREAMGILQFSDLEVEVVGSNAAIVHGGWVLTRAKDKPSGLFTLVFREFTDGWVIVSDTTTSAG